MTESAIVAKDAASISAAPKVVEAIPPVVLDLLRRVQTAAKSKPSPHWVPVGSLHLHSIPGQVAVAVMLAELEGWIVLGGTPPHSVRITGTGLMALRGLGEPASVVG
jgi:hypothetical protein